MLSTFVGAGIPMSRALSTIAEETGSVLFRRVLLTVLADLEKGQNLSDALVRHPGVFSPLYIDLIRVAELTGNLESTLKQLAGYMRRDMGTLRRVRSAMVYPAVIAVVAAVVVVILVVFAMPAFVRIFAEFHVQLPLATRILLAIVAFLQAWFLVIGGAILAFYQGYGNAASCGLTFLGLPKSNERPIGGYPGYAHLAGQGIVLQFFERGVLVYDPQHQVDSPPGAGPVYLAHLYTGAGVDPMVGKLEAQITAMQSQPAAPQEHAFVLQVVEQGAALLGKKLV